MVKSWREILDYRGSLERYFLGCIMMIQWDILRNGLLIISKFMDKENEKIRIQKSNIDYMIVEFRDYLKKEYNIKLVILGKN